MFDARRLTAGLALLLLSSSSLLACTVDSPAPSDESDDEETGADEAAVTATKYYDCRGSFSDDVLTRMEVGLSATKLTLTDLSKDAVPPDVGRIDASYQPSPSYAGATRFVGFPKILDAFTSSDIANMELIVSKELKAKADQGKLWIRTSGSGGDSTSYSCKAKPAKLKVVTSKKSRLACSLDKLSCVDDNPPGSTCLADLFVNQTISGAASLKLTYLDHFGVHVQERRPALGLSEELSRTTKKFDAAWDNNGSYALKLQHRGGITYTGTFKLPSGEVTTVKCNDLAMLD